MWKTTAAHQKDAVLFCEVANNKNVSFPFLILISRRARAYKNSTARKNDKKHINNDLRVINDTCFIFIVSQLFLSLSVSLPVRLSLLVLHLYGNFYVEFGTVVHTQWMNMNDDQTKIGCRRCRRWTRKSAERKVWMNLSTVDFWTIVTVLGWNACKKIVKRKTTSVNNLQMMSVIALHVCPYLTIDANRAGQRNRAMSSRSRSRKID